MLRLWFGTSGLEFTVIKYLEVSPGQPDAPDVIATAEYVTVIGFAVLFINVCEGILLFPLFCTPVMPIGVMATHGKFTPGVGEVIVTAFDEVPEQIF